MDMTILPGLAGRLRTLRRARGLTQEQAAQRSGASVRTWARWEAAHGTPCTQHLVGIAAALDVPITELLCGCDRAAA